MRARTAETVARSKITSKAQTVVPRVIRERLGLRPGDVLRYRIVREGVLIDRWPVAADDPFSEFTEWASAEDDAAFENL
jgi:antitoxin PrlF